MTLILFSSVLRHCPFVILSTESSSVNTGIVKSSTPRQLQRVRIISMCGDASPPASVKESRTPMLLPCPIVSPTNVLKYWKPRTTANKQI